MDGAGNRPQGGLEPQPPMCMGRDLTCSFLIQLLQDFSHDLLVTGISALFSDPALLAQLSKKSRFFQLPNGSSFWYQFGFI